MEDAAAECVIVDATTNLSDVVVDLAVGDGEVAGYTFTIRASVDAPAFPMRDVRVDRRAAGDCDVAGFIEDAAALRQTGGVFVDLAPNDCESPDIEDAAAVRVGGVIVDL